MAIDRRMLHEDTADAHPKSSARRSLQWIMRLFPGHTLSIGSRRKDSTPSPHPRDNPGYAACIHHPTCLRILARRAISLQYLTPYTRAPRMEDPHPWHKKKQALHKLLGQERKLSSTSGKSHPNSDFSRYFLLKPKRDPLHRMRLAEASRASRRHHPGPTAGLLIGRSLMHLSFHDLILQKRYPRFGCLPHGSTVPHPCRPTGACERDRP